MIATDFTHYQLLMTGVYMFLAGSGLAMTWALWWWQRNQNGDRRVRSWVVTVQALAWSIILLRGAQTLIVTFHGGQPGIPWFFIGVALMDAGLAGHIWTILQRRHKGETHGLE